MVEEKASIFIFKILCLLIREEVQKSNSPVWKRKEIMSILTRSLRNKRHDPSPKTSTECKMCVMVVETEL